VGGKRADAGDGEEFAEPEKLIVAGHRFQASGFRIQDSGLTADG
jgi:hypothetical protein